MRYTVSITWDDEACVWYVSSTDVPGLVTEAPSYEAMLAKLEVMVPEMLEENGIANSMDVPFELLAQRHAVAHRTRCQ